MCGSRWVLIFAFLFGFDTMDVHCSVQDLVFNAKESFEPDMVVNVCGKRCILNGQLRPVDTRQPNC